MIRGRNGGTLHPFEKGKSGNPAGTTRAKREKALLRDFISEGMAMEIPPEIAEALQRKLEGLKVGEAIAADILLKAVTGDRAAIEQIIRMEPQKVEHAGSIETSPRSAEYVPVEDEVQALEDSARDGEQIH